MTDKKTLIIILIAVIFFALIVITGIMIGVAFIMSGAKNIAPPPTPTSSTEPAVSVPSASGSKYASDSGLLKIKSDIEAQQQKINSMDLFESQITPPSLDLNISIAPQNWCHPELDSESILILDKPEWHYYNPLYMITALNKRPGSEFELTINFPWDDVKKIYDQVFEEIVAETEVEGFRKGKAPRKLIEEKIDKGKVYGEVINRIIPPAYQKALEEHGLRPIIAPQIKIASAEEAKDWQIVINSCERPVVNLGEYKKAVAEINSVGKIIKPASLDASLGGPGQEEAKEDDQNKKISAIIDKLLEVCAVELGDILVESETHRLLSQLIEDVRQAGMTFEQYLQSTSQTQEQIHEKFHGQAKNSLKLEFILEAVAENLEIKVSPEEIDTVINKEADPKRQEALKQQSYVIASLLRRDKTIAKLLTI